VRRLIVIKGKKDRDMKTEIKKLRPVELWILLILKAGGGEVCCKTKIMKILFLLERVYGITGVKFEPYSYGPWSKDVEDALRRLVELGLIEERELPKPQEGPEHTGLMYLYRLTEKGRSVVEKIPLKIRDGEFPTRLLVLRGVGCPRPHGVHICELSGIRRQLHYKGQI
jgi:hypothetical protein